MRIAYVITRADAVGGASVHVRDLARAMRERGHEAVVFLGGEGPVTEQFTFAGVPFRPLRFLLRSIHPIRDVRAIAELARTVKEFGPDLLSLHTAKAGWIGRVVASRLGIPALYTPHGWPFGNRFSPLARIAFRFAERAASKGAAAVICVCEHEKELALRLRVADERRLRVIHNGVHDVPPDLRANPLAEPVRIVSVARFAAPKDHDTLLRAMALIRERPWELDLVGDGPLEPRARSLTQTLGIADRVRFLGYQPDPAAVLARAQIFVLSSRSEGFPRSILEAMRAGLPVVASRVGGVPEAVKELLVPPGEPASLADAVSRLLDDANLRQQLGLDSQRRYESHFRFERMAEETLAVYREFSGENSRSLGTCLL